MSNSAWCDLNKNCTVLKLYDMCHNSKCICQKQIIFSAKQFQLEGTGFKNTMTETSQGFQTAGQKFKKPRETPTISAAVAVKTQNLQSAQISSNILKSLTGGKLLSLTNMHGHGLRLKVFEVFSNEDNIINGYLY